MRYMLLCYHDGQASEEVGETARQEAMQEAVRLTPELDEKAQYVLASPLRPPSTATSVRVRNGKPLVAGGACAGTREGLAGCYPARASDREQAIAIALRTPGARNGTIEIRPLLEIPGFPAGKYLSQLRTHNNQRPSTTRDTNGRETS